MDELIQARDDLGALRDLFFDAATVFRFLTPLQDAFGFAAFRYFLSIVEEHDGRALIVARYAPLMLLIKDEIPDYAKNLETILETAPQLRAAASFVESLPEQYQRLHGVLKLQALPQADQRRLVLDWAKSHPREAQIAGLQPTVEA
jgi:hypothetical protein